MATGDRYKLYSRYENIILKEEKALVVTKGETCFCIL